MNQICGMNENISKEDLQNKDKVNFQKIVAVLRDKMELIKANLSEGDYQQFIRRASFNLKDNQFKKYSQSMEKQQEASK